MMTEMTLVNSKYGWSALWYVQQYMYVLAV